MVTENGGVGGWVTTRASQRIPETCRRNEALQTVAINTVGAIHKSTRLDSCSAISQRPRVESIIIYLRQVDYIVHGPQYTHTDHINQGSSGIVGPGGPSQMSRCEGGVSHYPGLAGWISTGSFCIGQGEKHFKSCDNDNDYRPADFFVFF